MAARRAAGGYADVIKTTLQEMLPFGEDCLQPLINRAKDARIVMLGEATHGTHEFYTWRDRISKLLMTQHGFSFIAVEGDWPACHRLNTFIQARGPGGVDGVNEAIQGFHRWPTWMWGNEEVKDLALWMRQENEKRFERSGISPGAPHPSPLRPARVPAERNDESKQQPPAPPAHSARDAAKEMDERALVNLYGLDVYSLFESMDEVLSQLTRLDPKLADAARRRYSCFDRFHGNEMAYAKSLLIYPAGCREGVVKVLQDVLRVRLDGCREANAALWDAQQNARIVKSAEDYYRAMLEADHASWNVRDGHMMSTLRMLLDYYGPDAKCIVWAHNTHVGDYRATDMLKAGEVNIGGLAREEFGEENVYLVGFSTHMGEVVASHMWDGPITTMPVTPAQPGSYEEAFHRACVASGRDQFMLLFDEKHRKAEHPFAKVRGQRAIGVVYQPQFDPLRHYPQTKLSHRYDAFVFMDRTTPVQPVKEQVDYGEIPESYPFGE